MQMDLDLNQWFGNGCVAETTFLICVGTLGLLLIASMSALVFIFCRRFKGARIVPKAIGNAKRCSLSRYYDKRTGSDSHPNADFSLIWLHCSFSFRFHSNPSGQQRSFRQPPAVHRYFGRGSSDDQRLRKYHDYTHNTTSSASTTTSYWFLQYFIRCLIEFYCKLKPWNFSANLLSLRFHFVSLRSRYWNELDCTVMGPNTSGKICLFNYLFAIISWQILIFLIADSIFLSFPKIRISFHQVNLSLISRLWF